MKLSEIYKIAEEIAPKKLSDEACQRLSLYDNSGILIDAGEDIEGAVFSLDLSFAAIEKAKRMGANLIVTHHPAIYGKMGEIRFDDEYLTGAKITECLKNSISVIGMHLNLDFADGGTDECLMDGVVQAAKGEKGTPRIANVLSEGGYGRVYDLPEISLRELSENMRTVFSTNRILTYGEGEKKIRRAASFCGAGADAKEVLFALHSGADALISSDFKHHVITLATESGLAVIALTHYASENFGFKKYYQKICQRIDIPCVYHTDENLL